MSPPTEQPVYCSKPKQDSPFVLVLMLLPENRQPDVYLTRFARAVKSSTAQCRGSSSLSQPCQMLKTTHKRNVYHPMAREFESSHRTKSPCDAFNSLVLMPERKIQPQPMCWCWVLGRLWFGASSKLFAKARECLAVHFFGIESWKIIPIWCARCGHR